MSHEIDELKTDLQAWNDGLKDHMDGRFAEAKTERDAIATELKGHTQRLNDHLVDHERALGKLWTSIGKLTVKSGVWGALAGLIPVALVLLWWLLRKT